jgi:uncharacterized protein (DUF305 family)
LIRYLTSLVAVGALLLAGCGGDDDSAADGGTPAVDSSVPFDRAFIDGMVPHHEGAIAMAKAAKTAGLAQPELVEIADAIIETQQQEIDEMKSWRAGWFGSSEIDPAGADALGLSEEEMGMQHDASAIEAADDVDSAFASMMIDHHNGAIQMAELALERAQHEEVRQLAEEITEAQLREIGIMEKYVDGGEHDTH